MFLQKYQGQGSLEHSQCSCLSMPPHYLCPPHPLSPHPLLAHKSPSSDIKRTSRLAESEARNSLGENRSSGRDEFIISVQQRSTLEDGKETLRDLPFEFVDLNTGQYEVKYVADEGQWDR